MIYQSLLISGNEVTVHDRYGMQHTFLISDMYDIWKSIIDEVGTDKLSMTVKLFKERSGWNLKESKDFCDACRLEQIFYRDIII